MDYYRILNLEQEPFCNSPDPGLFFNSNQHLEALQKLEISIRLKRGLAVVTGDVGTGKTTISRQLIQKISSDPKLNYSLMLDPGVNTVTDFLCYVLNLLTGEKPQGDEDEYSLKERIKNYLFHQGVDKKIITVLIIDEGQKLPLICLEVLRELLNYETNDQKLLQIVIFAQKEFKVNVAALPNFKDRINFSYSLGPLNFKETRGMIRYRLDQSLAPGKKGEIFSYLAYLAVYLFTRGFPRKIVKLCHHIILALIIQNRSKAGLFLVGACGLKVFLEKKMSSFLKPGGAALLLVVVVCLFCGLEPGRTSSLSTESPAPPPLVFPVRAAETGVLFDVPALPKSNLSVADKNVALTPPPMPMPRIYGRLVLLKDTTLYSMMVSVYGDSQTQVSMDAILKANPAIKDPDHIMAGRAIDFPVIDSAKFGWDKDAVCIVFSREQNFNKAYAISKKYRQRDVDTRVLPIWIKDQGFLFLVVVNRPFKTMASAQAFKQQIPTSFAALCTRLELSGSIESRP